MSNAIIQEQTNTVVVEEVPAGQIVIEEEGTSTTLQITEQAAVVEVDETTTIVQVTQSTPPSIVVDSPQTSLNVVEETVSVIVAGQQGPQGIPGPEGPEGPEGPAGPSGDLAYTHNQELVSDVWTINHNLGKIPSVTVVDSGDNIVVGEVFYPSNTTVVLTFSGAFAGKAYLN